MDLTALVIKVEQPSAFIAACSNVGWVRDRL